MTQQAQSDSIEVGDSVTLLFFAGWIMMDLLFLLETYTNLFKRSCLEVNHMLCLGDPIACCLSIASVSYWIYLIYVNLCYLDLSRDT